MTTREIHGKTILVTGGAGFIGSHIVDALVDENEVRVLDDLSSGRRENVHERATLIEGDVRNRETVAQAMNGVDLVFHEASLVSVQQSIEEPETSQAVNARAVVTVLERARRENARVVLASSAAIYGHPSKVPVTESEPKTPASPYGIDKLAADHYARVYNEVYGLPTVALRYFNVYGPRQTAGDYSGVISIFDRQARSGEPITVDGNGEQTRDFVHVDDVVQANLLAATTEHVGEAFNTGTGKAVTIKQLAEVVREVTGSESEIVHQNPRPGDIEESVADVSKVRELLGFEPRMSLKDGLGTLIS